MKKSLKFFFSFTLFAQNSPCFLSSGRYNKQGEHSAWWACQTRFAKRGNMKTKQSQCRDRCFLVPYWMVERALLKIRERWPVTKFNNVAINRKFSTHWQNIIQKAYPGWPGITARGMRRFFAVYAYSYFGNSIFTEGTFVVHNIALLLSVRGCSGTQRWMGKRFHTSRLLFDQNRD